MYEQDQVSVLKRLIALGVIFITVFMLLWWAVWFIWLRSDNIAKKPTPKRPTTSQTTQQGDNEMQLPQQSSDTGNQSVNVPNSDQAVPAPAVAPQPSELANTGAGDLLLPLVVTSVVAGIAYEYALRRRAQA